MRLSEFFRSQAHFEVLRILSTRTMPLRLRNLASLTDLYVRSIERVLQDLAKKQLVIRANNHSRIVYSLNQKHWASVTIQKMFQAIGSERVASLDDRAQRVLAFSEAVMAAVARAKK